MASACFCSRSPACDKALSATACGLRTFRCIRLLRVISRPLRRFASIPSCQGHPALPGLPKIEDASCDGFLITVSFLFRGWLELLQDLTEEAFSIRNIRNQSSESNTAALQLHLFMSILACEHLSPGLRTKILAMCVGVLWPCCSITETTKVATSSESFAESTARPQCPTAALLALQIPCYAAHSTWL